MCTRFPGCERRARPCIDYDVIVLGAGAAGLLAAARAAECGARVLLVEKNRRPGVKILISGGTRCNITNARGLRRLDSVSGPIDPAFDANLCRGIRSIQQAFGENGAFLAPALRSFDVDATIRMFRRNPASATKIEANGKIFPASDKAAPKYWKAAWCIELSARVRQLRGSSPVLSIERLEEKAHASAQDSAVRTADHGRLLPQAIILRRRGPLVPRMRHNR